MTLVRFAVRTLVIACLLIWSVSVFYGQTTSRSLIFGPTPPELIPPDIGKVLPLSGLDNVDLYSGHLSLSVPLHQIGGRGDAGYTITVAISNPPWAMENFFNGGAAADSATAKWWHPYQTLYTPGFVILKRSFEDYTDCGSGTTANFKNSMTQVVFLRPDGSELQLDSTKVAGPILDMCTGTLDLSRGAVFRSRDASGTWFHYDGTVPWCSAPGPQSPNTTAAIFDRQDAVMSDTDRYDAAICGTLFFRNGVRFEIDMGRVRRIVDRNGNYTQLTYCGDVGAPSCGGQLDMLVASIVDPVGRTTSVSYGSCPASSGQTCDTITYPGYNGANRSMQVLWGPPVQQLRPDLSAVPLFPQLRNAPNLQTGNSVYSILLADQVSKYSLYYNPYGEVARMILPTGGAVDYEFGQGFPTGSGVYPSGQVLDDPSGIILNSPWQPFIYRRLLKRREYLTTPPLGTTSAGLDTLATSISTYNSSESVSSVGYYSQTNPPEVDSATFSASGPVVRTVTGPGGAPVVVQEQHSFSLRSAYPGGNTGNPPRADANLGGAGVNMAFQAWAQSNFTLTVLDPLEGIEISNVTSGVEAVSKAYFVNTDGVALACQQVITIDSSSATRLFAYDSFDNVIDLYEYDYGAGPPIITVPNTGFDPYLDCPSASGNPAFTRHTQTAYVTDSRYLNDPNVPGSGPAWLPSLAGTVQTFDGANALAAATRSTYDCSGQNSCGLAADPIPNIDAAFDVSYTTRGNVTRIERWLNNGWITTSTAGQYDLAGNPLQISDGKTPAASTNYSYSDAPSGAIGLTGCSSGLANSHAFVTQISNGLLQKTNLQWDCNIGKAVTITDPNRVWTTATYDDPLERLKLVNRFGQTETSYNYPDLLTTETRRDVNAFGNAVNLSKVLFDGLGREIETRQYVDSNTCASGGYVGAQRQYDALGRVSQVSNPFCASGTPAWTISQYDGVGRLTDTIPPDNATVHTDYSNNVATTFDPPKLDGSPRYQRAVTTDAFGRVTQVVENGSFTTTYKYDVFDDLTCVSQSGQLRVFDYDSMGRLISVDNPETRIQAISSCAPGNPASRPTIKYAYDNANNLTGRTDSAGTAVSYVPDALNRISSKSSTDGTVQYVFDQDLAISGENDTNYPIGRLSSTTFGTVVDAYRYDALGRFKSSQEAVDTTVPFVFHYDYVPAGISMMKYPSGKQVVTTYESAGRPNGVTGYASGVQYAPHGTVQGFTFANGLSENWRYNSRLQPTCLTAAVGTAPPILSLTNAYTAASGSDLCTLSGSDNNGNVLAQQMAIGSSNFSFSYGYVDGLNRVTSATETNGALGWNQQFGYDTWGNRSVTSSLGTSIWAPPGYDISSNRISGTAWGYVNSSGNAGAGNLTTTPFATMSYDVEGRLKTFQSTPLSVNDQYVYDGDGRRVKAIIGGTTVMYVYDAMGNLAAEYGSPQQALGTQFVTADHLGSTRLVTDRGAAVTERHDYTPFGEEVPTLGCNQPVGPSRSPRCDIAGYLSSTSLRIKFTGKERDAETGLDFFEVRYFSGAQGRFTSPDPAGGELVNPQSLNRYAYALNNPLRFTDPTGMYTCKDTQDGSCTSEQDVKFEKALDTLRNSTDKSVARAAAAYGIAGKDNGVTVAFADLEKKGEGGNTVSVLGADAKGNLQAQSAVTISTKATGTDFVGAIGHEGSHVADAQSVVASISITDLAKGTFTIGGDITRYQSEQRAYAVTNSILRSANETGHFFCGTSDCLLGSAVKIQSTLPGVIDNILRNSPLYRANGKPLSPTNQGGSVVSGLIAVPH